MSANRTECIFCNTAGRAERIFQELWKVNDRSLPIAIHHGSLDREARQRAETAMADGRLRALVATSSLDLGLDWGDVDCVIQMGAPKGASRLLQRIGRANHRLDEPSRALIVRSEEHTSELQSLMRISYAVFCLKKKPKHTTQLN